MEKTIPEMEKLIDDIKNNNIESLLNLTCSYEIYSIYETYNPKYKGLYKQAIDKILEQKDIHVQYILDILWYSRYKAKAANYLLNYYGDDPQSFMQIISHATGKTRDIALNRLNDYFRSKGQKEMSLEEAIWTYK